MDLASAIRSRMSDRGLTQMSVASAAGISQTTLSRLLNGQTAEMRTQTARSLESALMWESGSIDAIQRGESPVDADGQGLDVEAELRMIRERLDEIMAAITELTRP